MSEPAMKWLETKQCWICGKRFSVLYPDLWRYKRAKYGATKLRWFCTWSCLRAYDAENERGTKEMDDKVRKRDRAEVVMGIIEATNAGQSVEEYLESLGYQNPTARYYELRKWAKEHQPALYESLPVRRQLKRGPKPKAVKVLNGKEYEPATLGDAMDSMQASADKFFDQCRDMGLNIPDTEAPDADRDFDDRTTVSAIRVDGLGEFYHDKKFNSLDWRTDTGDEVSMAPWSWGQLADDLPKILKRLGVDEYE